MMEHYSTEMKKRNEFFFKNNRYKKHKAKSDKKFLKSENVVGMRKTCYGMYTMRKEEQKNEVRTYHRGPFHRSS